MNPALGQLVLAIHLAVIAFNVLGLVAIPLGAKLGWTWVRIRWWRALHVVSWVVVAVLPIGQEAGAAEDGLTGDGAQDPLVMRWVNALIYWDLPMWAFTALYLALFATVLALWKLVPPNRPGSPSGTAR